MITVSIYCYPDRQESKRVVKMVEEFSKEIPAVVSTIDLNRDPGIANYLGGQSPVVQAGPYRVKQPFTDKDIRVAMLAAAERHESNRDNPEYQDRLARGRTITKSDRFNQWFSKKYSWFFVIILFLYVGLAVLTPVLMKTGATGPARVLYTLYKPFCHQLAFRSFFLFGEQPYYPRELSGMKDVLYYEDVVGDPETNEGLLHARSFVGNEHLGYKIPLCERCLAIYAAMLVFMLVFALTGNRIKGIPWYLWIVIGLGPIGYDGASQLPAMMGINMPEWMIIRESVPFLRVLTGTLFGLSTIWFLMPQIEESMRQSRVILSKKFAYIDAMKNLEADIE